tara:strand:- start:1556 stop:1804 length:249 start_codon:yes stop_codon:yes gene_type:complete
MYSIKETPAAVRRLENLNLTKANIKKLLKTNEGRKSIGYNYLNLYNPPEEISYDGVKKSGKREGQVLVYNRTEGLNRQERRS